MNEITGNVTVPELRGVVLNELEAKILVDTTDWGRLIGNVRDQRDLMFLFRPSFINKKAQPPHVEGSVTSGSVNSLTDSSQNWSVDEWKDKVVRIQKNGGSDFEFGLVLSNTSDTLFFDDNLIFAPCVLCGYKIIDTLVLGFDDLPEIVALNIMNHDVGVVLPVVSSENERLSFNIYVERSNDGLNVAPVIGRGKDYQLGAKYGTLQYKGEGVTLASHLWDGDSENSSSLATPHWDIINMQGIQRFASGYWAGNEEVTEEEFAPKGSELVFVVDNVRRFLPFVRDGIKYLRYTSLIERAFLVQFDCVVEKTGGVGDLEIAIAKRRASDGVLEVIDTRVSQSRFGQGLGVSTITVKAPVIVNRNDELVVVARINGGGNFFIYEGSSVDVTQI